MAQWNTCLVFLVFLESAAEIMAIIFWDNKEFLLIEYIRHIKTILFCFFDTPHLWIWNGCNSKIRIFFCHPDLAPSDDFLFGPHKISLKGIQFLCNKKWKWSLNIFLKYNRNFLIVIRNHRFCVSTLKQTMLKAVKKIIKENWFRRYYFRLHPSVSLFPEILKLINRYIILC